MTHHTNPYNLHIYREVCGIEEDTIRRIQNAAQAEGLYPPVTFLPLLAYIVSPGEIRAALTHARQTVTPDRLMELSNAISDNLPASADTSVSVICHPIGEHTDRRRPSKRFITMGSINPVVIVERAICHATIKRHLNDQSLAFADNPHLSQIYFGRYNDPSGQDTSKFRKFLTKRIDLLPATLELSPVMIANDA